MVRRGVIFVLCACALGQIPDPDSDRDGLPDFLETHKYLTDPAKADSDGDGTPDGEWSERSEYAYTIRTIVQVMRPADVTAMNDDFQDARLLDATPEYLEVEVTHYPLNTAGRAIPSSPAPREAPKSMSRWLEPGATANWDEAMRKALTAELPHPKTLDERTFVEKTAAWLLARAKCEDGFTTFFTAFDGARPFVPDLLRPRFDQECSKAGRTAQQQWERELFAKGMVEHKTRGSCTSTAIYLTGCLRALGIPTRIVLCIPAIDPSDDRELEMVRHRVMNHWVRRTMLAGLEPLRGGWTSHTFNEVWVGGRWRRLNGDRLGQPVLDENFGELTDAKRRLFGLMTHVATLHDWADARAWETIGRRQGLGIRNDAFGGPNPYSTVTIRDRYGVHCKLERPAVETMTIDSVGWSDEELGERDGLRLLAHIRDWRGFDALKEFTTEADSRFFLEADGHKTLGVHAGVGGVTSTNGDKGWAVIPLGPADRRDLVAGVRYRLRAQNANPLVQWIVADGVEIVRK